MRSSAPVSPEFAAAFRARASEAASAKITENRNGAATPSSRFGGSASENETAIATLTFAEFMELALYHPELGYYRRNRKRVGYGGETDFYTASSSGAVFGELIVAACVKLLGESGNGLSSASVGTDVGASVGIGVSDESASALSLRSDSDRANGAESDRAATAATAAKDYTFIEIGAETEGGVLAGVTHPFAATKTVRVGEDFSSVIGGRCVVFSNELFDAQPIRRFIRREGAWRECGVALSLGGELSEIELSPPFEVTCPDWLQAFGATNGTEGELPDGYRFDAPRAAADLAAKIAAQSWTGLFVAFDYGKSLAELTSMTPNGTARAYFKHTQSNDLLANAGEQDLTAHVCWDWLAETLTANGFDQPVVESQEAFFIGHAGEFLAKTMADEATRLSQRKLALLQLLHPTHLGQKFQVLWARR